MKGNAIRTIADIQLANQLAATLQAQNQNEMADFYLRASYSFGELLKKEMVDFGAEIADAVKAEIEKSGLNL